MTNATTPNNSEKNGINQIITQNYQARTTGRFILAPFTIVVNGRVLRSEGAVLNVQPLPTASSSANTTLSADVPPPNGAAFLLLWASKPVIYRGEGVGLSLSFFVADNYPYELNFTALDRQLRAITKKIRPANAWEENRPVTELKPVPVLIGGRKFREIPLYHSVFYPLTARPLTLPVVTLRLLRPRPKIGPPSSGVDVVAFSSKPLTVTVRSLPMHPLRERVAVGSFRLQERLDQPRVRVGQSVRYGFTIEGEGNVATLPAPAKLTSAAGLDVFPPEEWHTIRHGSNQVSGQKTFTYFMVPRQQGTISLADQLQWIYFDPQRVRYDTLRSQLQVQVGAAGAASSDTAAAPTAMADVSDGAAPAASRSLYAGIDALDSTHQPIRISVLIRSVANVLLVIMLLGMIVVLFKK